MFIAFFPWHCLIFFLYTVFFISMRSIWSSFRSFSVFPFCIHDKNIMNKFLKYIMFINNIDWASLVVQTVKNLPALQETEQFNPCIQEIPWRREWLPIPFLPSEFHGRRSLVGYSPWGRKESDMPELLTHTYIFRSSAC